jgi:hypothetical protein
MKTPAVSTNTAGVILNKRTRFQNTQPQTIRWDGFLTDVPHGSNPAMSSSSQSAGMEM